MSLGFPFVNDALIQMVYGLMVSFMSVFLQTVFLF